MGIFDDLSTEGHEQTNDRLGGYSVRETDSYRSTIKMAYTGKSQGGARFVALILTLPDSTEYNETIYVTNKKGENSFPNPQDNTKKISLPGFVVINDICVVTTGQELKFQETEEKVIKIYDYDEKKEMPKTVPVLTELLGKTFHAGILKTLEFKNVKDGNGDYVPSEETREVNNIDKVFHDPSMITVPEGRKAEEMKVDPVADFHPAWVKKNKGVTRDKTKGAGNGNAGKSGRPAGTAPAAGGERKTSSLFGKN